MNYLKNNNFIITCPARSGSTFLVHLLRSHPEIICHGEVFGIDRIGHIMGLAEQRKNPDFEAELVKRMNSDPAIFAYKFLFDTQKRSRAGFKFKHDEMFDPAYAPITEFLVKDKDIKVINLWRNNLIDILVSHEVVLKQTGVTLVTDSSKLPEIKPFRLNVDHARTYCENLIARRDNARALFSSHRSLDISYDEIATLDGQMLMCDFLEIERKKLDSPTLKIINESKSSLIENYDEIRAELGHLE